MADERPATGPPTGPPTVPPTDPNTDPTRNRREFLSRASTFAMLGGLAAGYGTVGVMAGRYLYPARPRDKAWLYVAVAGGVETGSAFEYRTPVGETVTIARKGESGTADDFVALSSTCPHLGCQVHWEQAEARFFCPCHNGTFDAQGRPTGGPPAEAKQELPRYPLKLEAGLLYIEAPTERLARADAPEIPRERTV